MEELFGAVNAGLVILMILGIVEAVKKTGLEGNKLLFVSMAVGSGLGGLYQASLMFPEIAPWVKVVVYGILTGLAASGLYDFAKKLLPGPAVTLTQVEPQILAQEISEEELKKIAAYVADSLKR